MRTRIFAVLFLLLCSTSVIGKIHVAVNEEIDFTRYKTYFWRKGTPAARENFQDWIFAAINRELQARGLKMATDGKPDIYVASVAFAQMGMAVRGNFFSLNSWGYGVITGEVVSKTTGHLGINLVDAATDQTVWRAIAEEAINTQKRTPVTQGKIDKIVSKMFRKFPVK